ncbi:helix-turn-helix domain-containing protein [Labilibaculum antarcticum]|uniref:AraC family transcriptional regulator n=1 Tax=Labilibaculum antarcticum TaxID=1717717 RepID=A0A1Y1CQN7_9BACT|nr:helix-turn-helix domain-containing protein [Labilibaculum antarcticum]BAX82574.1 AraC family transcriptional regulator [Labilibaculum antarcticum]
MKREPSELFEEVAESNALFHIHKLQNMCTEVRKQNGDDHMHDFYTITWIKEGQAIHATKYVEYTLRENSILFVPPGLMHRFIINAHCTGYSITFNETFFAVKESGADSVSDSTLFSNPDFRSIIQLDEKQQIVFKGITDLMEKEFANDDRYRHEMLLQQLKLFLLESRRIYEDQHDLNVSFDEDHPGSVIIKFKQLIDDKYKEQKNVSSYADLLNLRATCLNDITKKTTGITAGELIRNRVIKEAKKMLYGSDLNTKEIAYELGFQDPAYFSRFFKKYTNQTLSDYRNLIRK